MEKIVKFLIISTFSIIGILILLTLFGVSFTGIFESEEIEETYTPTWTEETLGEVQVDSGVVGYMAVQLGAVELSNIPFTSITPKIEIIVDGEAFNIEIKKGVLISTSGPIENEDIIIYMEREDVIDILNFSNLPTDTIPNSISRGTISFEEKESRLILFSKGYLGLFKKFSGEEVPLNEENN